MSSEFVNVDWAGREVRIEHAWIGRDRQQAPLMVFLHEGLGSVAMWKDFPHRLCDTLGWRGLVYSRPGYGRSTPRARGEHWATDYMHRQAHELLPALFGALGIGNASAAAHDRPWLFGHSDGGSIALLHAAAYPGLVGGLVVVAPHIGVEPVSIASIAKAREAYLGAGLRQNLARYHDDPDSAFWGWNDAWLAPAFSRWDITSSLNYIECPILAVQGTDDEYGSMAQIEGIAQRLPRTRLLRLPGCGHSPHRDQSAALIAAVQDFVHQQPAQTPHPPTSTGDSP